MRQVNSLDDKDRSYLIFSTKEFACHPVFSQLVIYRNFWPQSPSYGYLVMTLVNWLVGYKLVASREQQGMAFASNPS